MVTDDDGLIGSGDDTLVVIVIDDALPLLMMTMMIGVSSIGNVGNGWPPIYCRLRLFLPRVVALLVHLVLQFQQFRQITTDVK